MPPHDAVPVHTAKTQLSRLIERALKGEEVVICRGKEPVVRLVPITPVNRRTPGAWKGIASLDRSFFDPLADDDLRAWEGG